MTYDGLQDWIYTQAINSEEDRVRRLTAIYEDAQASIVRKLESYRERQARGEITPQFEEFRLNQLNAEIDAEIANLYTQVERQLTLGFDDTMTRTYAYQSFAIEKFINVEAPFVSGVNYNLNFPILNKAAVNAAFSELIAGHTISDRIGQARTALQWKMREMTANIIAQGQTVKKLAENFQNLYDQVNYSKGRAETAARTEMLRAYSLGNDEGRREAEAAGVEFQYMWSATLSGNTRADHRAMDKKKAAIVDGEPVFTLPDGSKAAGPRMVARDSKGTQIGNLAAAESINCRCRRLDLPYGIEPTARAALMPDGEWKRVNGDMTAEEWYQKNYVEKAA